MVMVSHPPLPFTPPTDTYPPYAPYGPIPTRPAPAGKANDGPRAESAPAAKQERPFDR